MPPRCPGEKQKNESILISEWTLKNAFIYNNGNNSSGLGRTSPSTSVFFCFFFIHSKLGTGEGDVGPDAEKGIISFFYVTAGTLLSVLRAT